MTYFKKGCWNAICDICGFQFKSDELKQNWKGQMVCDSDFEMRNPQDFIQIPKDNPAIAWSRPEGADSFVAGATLNPLDKATGVVLSNGNLTASSIIRRSVRATKPISVAGSVYWELTVNGTGGTGGGIASRSASLNDDIYSTNPGVIYYADGKVYRNDSTYAIGNTAYVVGDIIGYHYNTVTGIISFYVNGVLQPRTGYSGLSGNLYPIVGGFYSDDTGTINFGPNFAYTPPPGSIML
jgi:hypothetical protein